MFALEVVTILRIKSSREHYLWLGAILEMAGRGLLSLAARFVFGSQNVCIYAASLFNVPLLCNSADPLAWQRIYDYSLMSHP